MLKLWNFDRSPFCWKVRIALAEKNVPHELVAPPKDKANDAAFAKLNPFRMTPVLELGDGRTLYESTVINEYLEDAHPDPAMLPKDPWERARIRLLEDTTDQYLYPAMRGVTMSQFEYAPPHLIRKAADQVDQELLETSRAKVFEQLTRLDKELEGRRWFGGDLFSLADAALVPPLTGGMRLQSILPDTRWRNLSSWIERVVERPSHATAAPREPMTIREA